jgi:hypothetical protein
MRPSDLPTELRMVRLLLLTAMMSLAACAAGDPNAGGSASAWRKVDIDGEIRALGNGFYGSEPPAIVAAGERDGEPVFASVAADEVRFPFDLSAADLDGLRGLSSAGPAQVVSSDGDAGSDRSARIWIGDDYATYATDVPHDERGRKAVWLDPRQDGEENLRAVGVITDGDRWRIRAWEASDEWLPLDSGPQLLTDGLPTGDLLTGATESAVILVGDAFLEPGEPGPQLWRLEAFYYEPQQWQRVPMEPQPDGVTDLGFWELGWWVAGHRDGRPVVFDFDRTPGALLDVPDVQLDPEAPIVLLAAVDDGVPLLALQGVEGAAVWYRTSAGWQTMPLPTGTLGDITVLDGTLYVLLDGDVWYAPAPAELRSMTALSGW